MGHYLKTKRDRTFYIHDTAGTKGTIIAVHGLTGNHKQFMHYQEVLSDDYRFISYDLLGRGNSGPALPDTSIFTHAEDLADLIEALHINELILMGYSMGAYICAIAAATQKKIKPKALILLDGAGDADDTVRKLVLPSLNRMKKAYPSKESYAREMKELYTKLNVDWNERLKELVQYELKQTNGNWMHKSDAGLIEQDFESFYDFKPEVFERISCAVFLLIATGGIGENRSLFSEESYAAMKKRIRNLHTERSTQNHYEIVLKKQPAVTEQIKEFLSLEEIVNENR